MKKLTIEIVELPDHDGYEARIPELGEAIYRGCGNSEEEALESLGLVMFDVESKKICKNCCYWNRQDEIFGRCASIPVDPETCDLEALTAQFFWCCMFEEKNKRRVYEIKH